MQQYIDWRQPRAAAMEDIRKVVMASLPFWRAVFISTILAGVAAIGITYFIYPSMLWKVIDMLLLLVLFFALITVPILLLLLIRICDPAIYRIGADGLSGKISGHVAQACPWWRIDAFQITDHPTLPGLKRLEVQENGDGGWVGLCFDPAKVSEGDICAIMDAHVGRLPRTAVSSPLPQTGFNFRLAAYRRAMKRASLPIILMPIGFLAGAWYQNRVKAEPVLIDYVIIVVSVGLPMFTASLLAKSVRQKYRTECPSCGALIIGGSRSMVMNTGECGSCGTKLTEQAQE